MVPVKTSSLKMCPLIIFIDYGPFAAAWRRTGDQSGDDTSNIIIGNRTRNDMKTRSEGGLRVHSACITTLNHKYVHHGFSWTITT